MILTSSGIVFHLLDRGLLTAESVVDGDLIVVEVPGRNRNFKLIRQRDPGYFIKQAQPSDPTAASHIQREAAFYWLIENDGAFAPLQPDVPQRYSYDPQRHLLILALIKGDNLLTYHHRLAHFPLDIAAHQGAILGRYHRIAPAPNEGSRGDPPSLPRGGRPASFPRLIPWILSAHRLHDWPLRSNGAGQQVLRIIRHYADFHQVLDQLRQDWQTESLIHGDLKWENCVLSDEGATSALKIVDWETADFGDPCWDTGAILQSYLTFWINSIPMGEELSIEQSLGEARYPIEAMQPAIHAFWHSYLEARQVNNQAAPLLLKRSIQHAAARMLQTAYEHMVHSPHITTNALALLQFSLNVLLNPDETATELLNL